MSQFVNINVLRVNRVRVELELRCLKRFALVSRGVELVASVGDGMVVRVDCSKLLRIEKLSALSVDMRVEDRRLFYLV